MSDTCNIRQPKPRADVSTEHWDGNIVQNLEWFVGKWRGISDSYFQIYADDLEKDYDWCNQLMFDIPEDVLEKVLNGDIDLFVLLEYPGEW